MLACDLSVPANIVGILLEVVGLLIVILHDWRREQERKRAQGIHFRRTITERITTADEVNIAGSATLRTSGSARVGEPTAQERVNAELASQIEELRSQLKSMSEDNQRLRSNLGGQESEARRLQEQQSEISETVQRQQQEAGRREGWRFNTSLLAGAFVFAGASMQIFVATCG